MRLVRQQPFVTSTLELAIQQNVKHPTRRDSDHFLESRAQYVRERPHGYGRSLLRSCCDQAVLAERRIQPGLGSLRHVGFRAAAARPRYGDISGYSTVSLPRYVSISGCWVGKARFVASQPAQLAASSLRMLAICAV